jgi:uncharacterized protein YndB with AHSA1/START domain
VDTPAGPVDSEPSAAGATATAVVTLPSDCEIMITRTFHAPRDVVFDAWTSPDHVVHWWDPGHQPLAVCEIDLRPGGAFRFVPRGPDGAARTFAGRYREIAPPHRLVFTTAGGPSGAEATGRLLFDEHDGITMLTLTIACASAADRDALLKMRVDRGTVRTLDNLAAHLSAGR